MNKTLDINLSGRMFHVDEDAYKLLYDYLYNLRHAFERQEGGNEIMDDLENRLAELLLEREVIFAEDVEKIFGKRPWVSRSQEIMESENNGKAVNDSEAEASAATDSDAGKAGVNAGDEIVEENK